MQIKSQIKKKNLKQAFLEGSFGIEREGLRVLPSGELSVTPHPGEFGSRMFHPYIQTDFSESQIELVTPPSESIDHMMDWLKAEHDVAFRTIPEKELIWPFSMPAYLPSEMDIPIADSGEEGEKKYREVLGEKYGRKKQMISGLHYNFMLSPSFLELLFDHLEPVQRQKEEEALVLKLSKNYLKYQWVLTYLYGASPVSTENQDSQTDLDTLKKTAVRSLRISPKGYPSSNKVEVSYDSYEEYVKGILAFVEKGVLEEEREYYGAVRLRGKKSIGDILEDGVQYLEFRSFDVDPFSDLGLEEDTARFIHLFFLLMLWTESTASTEEVREGMRKNQHTATENPFSVSAYKKEGILLLEEMLAMIKELGVGNEAERLVQKALDQFEHPEQTLSARILLAIEKHESFIELGLDLAKTYKQEAWELPYRLRGFETMELSTQLLLFDAIQKGLEIEILDKEDQFIELKHNDHREYVKNGNMTSKDTYISALLMGNKTVTKKVLKEQGYIVPDGEEYNTLEEAKNHYWKAEGKQVVVKPKTTNYGVGISVFKEPADKEAYDEAIDLAFDEDDAVLVEDFAHGTEYRFFVLNGKTEAVLLRMPANVKGNGKQTIQELVAEKNKNPYRGTNHRAPLEIIQLGELEQLMLRQQGYRVTDIPAEGEIVYLRENSNISTGGDSIDYTDAMDDSYKEIAAGIAKAMGAKVCGVDLMIDDYRTKSTADLPGYTCLEANYNPAMHMHAYVTEGKGRRLTRKILEMLFPELTESPGSKESGE